MLKKALIILLLICMLPLGYSCGGPGDEETPPQPKFDYNVKNGGFETGDLSGWEIIRGDAFADAGVTAAANDIVFGGRVSYDKDGNYLFGRYNEAGTGAMRSSVFTIGGSGYITFKLGGGKNTALTYISIKEYGTDIELARFGNTYFNTTDFNVDPENYREANLLQYYADLSAYKGKNAYIEIVDDSTKNWGLLTFDSFVTYYKEPPDTTGMYMAEDIKPPYGADDSAPLQMANGDFSSGLEGWQGATGIAKIESGLMRTDNGGDAAIGVIRSPQFKLGGSGVISFKLAAAVNENKKDTYVSVKLWGTNREIYRTYNSRRGGGDGMSTRTYYLYLADYIGKNMYLEVVDNSTAAWGLVGIKEITTYYENMPQLSDSERLTHFALDIRDISGKYYVMRKAVREIASQIENPKLKAMFLKTFFSTLDYFDMPSSPHHGKSVTEFYGYTAFIITGDIPAMWLRDSSAQVLPYIQFAPHDEDVKALIKGLLRRQFIYIRLDPYANAFNKDGGVWERKWELDSLCYPFWLAVEYYKATGDKSIFDADYFAAVAKFLQTAETEQYHNARSSYSVYDPDKNKAKSVAADGTGLIWNGYRPSDDACEYNYLVPSNMFAVSILRELEKIYSDLKQDAAELTQLKNEIQQGIDTYAKFEVDGKTIYAYEVDGKGNKLLMDAANIPSLLSLPWLGYCDVSDQIYKDTRAYILSSKNPYYFQGSYQDVSIRGIGDPHELLSGAPAPWHMALAMQILTSDNRAEIEEVTNMILVSDAGTNYLHEAFNANNPDHYSRQWFTWPNSLFAHAVITKVLEADITNYIRG